ncbi:hypothetical protein BDZ89DRAFT_409115 [Hymenopellis radicata]|nr:hypothetical protein BDZ89DRAFT_409115 [Hymenopellis radicata]
MHTPVRVYTKPIGDFFDQGGKVEYALDGVTVIARYESTDFDSSHVADEAFVRLPRCENDYDFALVRKMVGLCAESE